METQLTVNSISKSINWLNYKKLILGTFKSVATAEPRTKDVALFNLKISHTSEIRNALVLFMLNVH